MQLRTSLLCLSLAFTCVGSHACERVLDRQPPAVIHSGLPITLDHVRSARAVTLDGQPGLHIVAGLNRRNVLHLKLLKADVRQGCVPMGKLQLQAHWHQRDYGLSAAHRTEADVVIRSVTAEAMVIELSAILVSGQTGQYLKVSPSVLVLRGPLLDALKLSD
jgi:hypothetical protein